MELNLKFPQITSWIRASKQDFQLVRDLGIKETGVLVSCSDYHIFKKMKMTRQQALEHYLSVVRDAFEAGVIPRCHLEDITRADFYGFVVPFVNELQRLSKETGIPVKMRACDTMGYGVPYTEASLPRSVAGIIYGLQHYSDVPSEHLELPGMAVDFKVTTDLGTRRIARAAFDYARDNGKNKVTVVTKANIMKKTDGKFTQICHQVAEEYPEITVEDRYIDIMTANLVDTNVHSQFQVVLLPNLYGDIITDEAAQLQGGVGTAGSANIGDRYAMFEAVHGSAPKLVEEGLADYADPRSILKAEAMLLRHIDYPQLGVKLETLISLCTLQANGTASGATAEAYTDELLKHL